MNSDPIPGQTLSIVAPRLLRRSSLVLVGLLLGLATANGLLAAEDAPPISLKQSFPVEPGGQLFISADRGSLVLNGTKTDSASIEVIRRVRGGSAADAERVLGQHEVEFSRDGNTIRVISKVRDPKSLTRFWKRSRLEVEIRATMPNRFDLDVSTAGGSVRAGEIEGRQQIRTSGGSLHLEKLTGSVKGTTAGGSIRGLELKGDIVVNTSGGSITLESVSGERLKAGTAGGSIHIRGASVPVEANTSGGSIQIETSASPLNASTAGGGIDATFTAAPKADCTLKTSAGSITLQLPGDSAFALDASTSAGSVRSDFPVAAPGKGNDRSSLKGPVQGGGPTMKLRTSAGSIRIRKP